MSSARSDIKRAYQHAKSVCEKGFCAKGNTRCSRKNGHAKNGLGRSGLVVTAVITGQFDLGSNPAHSQVGLAFRPFGVGKITISLVLGN